MSGRVMQNGWTKEQTDVINNSPLFLNNNNGGAFPQVTNKKTMFVSSFLSSFFLCKINFIFQSVFGLQIHILRDLQRTERNLANFPNIPKSRDAKSERI